MITRAVTRKINPPLLDGTLRLWTMQRPEVWTALQKEGVLRVNPDHPAFTRDLLGAYDWMRAQMRRRITGYEGGYPWWAYTHFLDLRYYRWNTWPQGERMVRLELAVPRNKALLSGFGSWHSVLNRSYLPYSPDAVISEREWDKWEFELKSAGLPLHTDSTTEPMSYPEPWETKLQASWEHIFDIEARSEENIQATFECLKLSQVIRVTEFCTQIKKRNF